MSIKVFGILELKKFNFSEEEQELRNKVELAFLVSECAIKNKIGINMGGNIFSGFIKSYEWISSQMPFELTDDPMDVNAECLFMGDGISVHVVGTRVDTGESLLSRMSRVQKFLSELLENEHISKIILDINIELGDEFETIEIKVNNFCEKMLELYKRENNWTPTVRIIVK